MAVVYGLLQAASHPWGSWQVLLPLFGGVALLVMIALESRVPDPLIPDAILSLDRRDFRAIRPLTPHKTFRVLPDDL